MKQILNKALKLIERGKKDLSVELEKEKLDELVEKNKEMYPNAFPEPCPINT